MIKPTIPLNEIDRLKALDNYKIIDTLPEASYDDITNIASLICNTPIALVSLIDHEKQFFKSHHGLDVSESLKDFAFCAHAINNPTELMIVNDSLKDKRFADNPLVTGSPNVIFYAGMPLITPEGYALGTICVIDNKPNDLTDQQKNALKSLSNQVIQLLELRKKNFELEENQKEIDLYAKEMETFAYAASHDLKEPIRMMKSFSLLLEKKYKDILDDKGKTYLNQIVDGAKRMEDLTNDLLEYAIAGKSNNSDTNDISIEKIINEIKDSYKLVIAEKEVNILYNELPIIHSSATATKQIFQNLIGNAIKYQLEGIKPIISIDSKESNTHWEFTVSDNGIGIAQENMEVVFGMFKRLHVKSTYGGSGIGLAICKKVVEQLGGKIWIDSELGKGSNFHFTILKNLN